MSQDLEKEYDDIKSLLYSVKSQLESALPKVINKVDREIKLIVSIKSKEGAINKCIQKNRKLLSLTDLVRCALLTNRKTNIENLIKEIKNTFNVIKIDIKDGTTSAYKNAIHIDVLIDGIICEIQIMRKNTWQYKEQTHEHYKSDLPKEEKQKLIDMYFIYNNDIQNKIERINKKKDFKLNNFDIEEYANFYFVLCHKLFKIG